jgi:glyceraldehyde 3-phosphate dehydrogenase
LRLIPGELVVTDRSAEVFEDWQEQEGLAEASASQIGRMYRERGVVTLLYGRPLMHKPPSKLLEEHRYVAQVEETDFTVRDTHPLITQMSDMPLTPARVDVGKLAMRWREKGRPWPKDFLASELRECVDGKKSLIDTPQDVVLYGFGRIGRLVARILMERAGNGEGLRLRAVVVRKGKGDDLHKRASLLERDSVHGHFRGNIDVDEAENALVANGNLIKVIYSDGPDQVDYAAHGLSGALICDNTGIWRDAEGLGLHLKAPGAGKVLLTAPGKGDIRNIVCGVNDAEIGDDRMLSAASCTTNAIVPPLKAVHDEFGIVDGHIETVHAYTNDQNLIDNYHSAERRGRSAPLNMVLTTTGAAKAVAKAVPELAGKLTGNAIRVPTPNVSMAVLMLNLEKEVSKETLNAHLRWSSVHGPMHKQIDYSASNEIASTDVVGSRHACVIDSRATIADGKRCVLYVWYDNEFGYSVQVVRMLQRMAGLEYPFFPR